MDMSWSLVEVIKLTDTIAQMFLGYHLSDFSQLTGRIAYEIKRILLIRME